MFYKMDTTHIFNNPPMENESSGSAGEELSKPSSSLSAGNELETSSSLSEVRKYE